VEFDLSYGLGKLYYKAGKWREAKRVTDLMKEHGTIMFYAEAQP
jgi:pentatricopeptide repeat protein